jgi:hypothetical protein
MDSAKAAEQRKAFFGYRGSKDEQGATLTCAVEAVLTKKVIVMAWQDLKDCTSWLAG